MKKIISLFLCVAMMLSVLPMAIFAEGNSGDIVLPSDCFHSSLSYTNNGDDHSVYCNDCESTLRTEAHNFVNGTCICGATEGPAEPIYDGSLKFTTTAFTMGAELKFVFIMTKATATKYPTEYVDIVVNGADGDTTTRFELEDMVLFNNTIYRVEFTGIGAKMMGDTFTATIHAQDANGNEIIGEPMSASIASAILTQSRKSSASDVTKRLAADLLNYGAAAQLYFNYKTDSLVSALLTSEEQAYATQEVPAVTNTANKTGSGPITIVNPTVTLGSKVTLNLLVNVANYSGDKTKLTYKVKDAATDEVVYTGKVVQQTGTIYKCVYDDVGAKRMRTNVTIGVYDENDQLVSQVQTWSVESYIASSLASSSFNATTKDLLKAMIKYGDSAAAYLG